MSPGRPDGQLTDVIVPQVGVLDPSKEIGSALIVTHPLLSGLLEGRSPEDASLRHVEQLAARPLLVDDWPEWVPEPLIAALGRSGVPSPWPHQVEAASLAWAGRSVVIATGTASGKSLAYQLPMLSAVLTQPRARVLYLAPTKALAVDQLRTVSQLELPGVRAATFDGDTPMQTRDWVREHANVVLSNPDMLHRSVLPRHGNWASFLRRLRFVVIDECHHYRGVFGSHVALILRRLRRLCASYGAEPVFVLASATSRDPATSASRLIGRDVSCVDVDLAPRGERTFALWEPPLTPLRGENHAPVRRAAGAEAARILADLVLAGARTLVFVRSRRGAEITALAAQRHLKDAGADDLAARIAAYRGGYLPEERRAVEAALVSGQLLGVATTNALELGVDITGLDAVVLAGYPGTLASLWQQSGRAGRRSQDALVVFVARDDPLDTYLVHHPEAVFGRAVEASVCDPENPFVLAPQLCCAAAERALTPADVQLFGGAAAQSVLDGLVARGVLRRRPNGWYWTGRSWPDVEIRGAGGGPVTVVEAGSGRLLGTVESSAAPSVLHAGAVYLHQGQSFVVAELELDRSTALVRAEEPDWTTSAREITDIEVLATRESATAAGVGVTLGTVRVSNQVVSYQRRRFNGEVLDEIPLDLPVQQLVTSAVWYTLSDDLCTEAALDATDLPGALHAAEHAAIGLLPLFATCDRWDIGGVSTARHADTGQPTVFVYDGHPGGAGFAAQGHAVLGEWLGATRQAIAACECAEGCPSCVQSPKCGNGNHPLDKMRAITVLDLVLSAVGPGPARG
ncbi:DEAD/DEAH box helicase [Jatrophihabitans telluris]|uniref:DEAD/DEAH box helicase n=1 Tax=Jatrophihabitans telluris TaxID=2038343 RepID=A0ABY4QXP9_9ACTN|nr:DEAD/DEAH box helicase [Jatrophihabitans telluris]UQX88139.1 DEAD/DEAH box helicase [Jatrophihabitans telluris]